MHSSALEASADHHLASGLDDACRGAKTLCFEMWIAHAVAVAVQVLKALSGFIAGVYRTPHGSQQIGKPAGIKFSMASACPLPSLRRIGAIDRFGYRARELSAGMRMSLCR